MNNPSRQEESLRNSWKREDRKKPSAENSNLSSYRFCDSESASTSSLGYGIYGDESNDDENYPATTLSLDLPSPTSALSDTNVIDDVQTCASGLTPATTTVTTASDLANPGSRDSLRKQSYATETDSLRPHQIAIDSIAANTAKANKNKQQKHKLGSRYNGEPNANAIEARPGSPDSRNITADQSATNTAAPATTVSGNLGRSIVCSTCATALTLGTNASALSENQTLRAAMAPVRLRDFMETTTIHGLSEIYRTRGRFTKCFFIIAFILCTALTIYECYAIVSQYKERPVATSYFVYEADNLSLPYVTICPFNRFNKQYLDAHNISAELMQYVEWAFFLVSPKYDFFDVSSTIRKYRNNSRRFESELDGVLERLNLTFFQLVQAASTQCRDIIQGCANNYLGLFDCCKKATSIITTMGQCFHIHSTIQIGSGFGMGLTLRIRLPFEKYTPSNNLPLNDGVMVKLTEPNKGFEYDAIFIPSGVHALMQLRATEMEFMNDPPRYTCLEKVPSDYSPILCFQQCQLQPMEEVCKCRYIGVGHDISNENTTTADESFYRHNGSVCRPVQLLTCGYQALAANFIKNPHYPTECKSRCKARCNYWQYQSTVSYAKFPSRVLADPHFKGNTSEEKDAHFTKVTNSEIILELFYEKLEYTLIKHFPSMTIDTFIANIGGQLGLWMGGSILSFVHLIVFMTLAACSRRVDKFKASRRRRRSKKKNGQTKQQNNGTSERNIPELELAEEDEQMPASRVASPDEFAKSTEPLQPKESPSSKSSGSLNAVQVPLSSRHFVEPLEAERLLQSNRAAPSASVDRRSKYFASPAAAVGTAESRSEPLNRQGQAAPPPRSFTTNFSPENGPKDSKAILNERDKVIANDKGARNDSFKRRYANVAPAASPRPNQDKPLSVVTPDSLKTITVRL